MDCKPVYHKQSTEYRVIYRPHTRWVAQRLTQAKPSREVDPWIDLHRPCTDQDHALQVMYERLPMKLV